MLARRNDQLRRWDESATAAIDLENPKLNKIRFEKKFMFLDSVTQQDVDEVKELLRLDVDVNHTNPDGISALHQVSHHRVAVRAWGGGAGNWWIGNMV